MKYYLFFSIRKKKSLTSPCVLTWRSENMVTVWTLLTSSKICQHNNGFYSANTRSEVSTIPHFPFPPGRQRSTVKPASAGKTVIRNASRAQCAGLNKNGTMTAVRKASRRRRSLFCDHCRGHPHAPVTSAGGGGGGHACTTRAEATCGAGQLASTP